MFPPQPQIPDRPGPAWPGRAALALAALTILPAAVGDFGGIPISAVEAGLSKPFAYAATAAGPILDVTAAPYRATPDQPGDNDAAAIQAAIQAAPAGGVVWIPAGTYQLETQINLKSRMALRGAGPGQTRLVAAIPGDPAAVWAASDLIRVPAGSSDVVVSDLTVDRDDSRMHFKNAFTVGSSSGTVCTRVILRNLEARGFRERGFQIRSSEHVLVEDCLATESDGNVQTGGHAYGFAINDRATNNIWIRRCRAVGPKIRHGFLLQYVTHHNLLEYNYAYANVYDAFDLHGEDEYANLLRYNTVELGNAGAFGIGNNGGTPVHDDSGPRNHLHSNLVLNAKWGVNLYPTVTPSATQYIERNLFLVTQYGLQSRAEGGTTGGMRDSLVRGNLFLGPWPTSTAATQAYYSRHDSNIEFSDNRVHGFRRVFDFLNVTGYRVASNDLRFNEQVFVTSGNVTGTESDNRTTGDDLPPLVLANVPGAYLEETAWTDGQFHTVEAALLDDGALWRPENPPPTALSCQWDLLSGPGQATWESPTALRTRVRFSAPGTYVLRLTAIDGSHPPVSDTMTLRLTAPTEPEAWYAPAQTSAEGWIESAWFGGFWAIGSPPPPALQTLYHLAHGWVFARALDPAAGAVALYDYRLEWLYTTRALHP